MIYSIQHLNIVPVLVVKKSHTPLLLLAAMAYVTLILHYFGWYKCVRALHLVAVHSIRLFVTSILHYFGC